MVLTVQPWHLDQEAIGRMLELVQSSDSCQRIDWSYFDVHIRDQKCALEKVRTFIGDKEEPRFLYFGVSFDMMWRIHWIRDGVYRGVCKRPHDEKMEMEANPKASHYPERWSAFNPLCFGPKQSILALEQFLIEEYFVLFANIMLGFCCWNLIH